MVPAGEPFQQAKGCQAESNAEMRELCQDLKVFDCSVCPAFITGLTSVSRVGQGCCGHQGQRGLVAGRQKDCWLLWDRLGPASAARIQTQPLKYPVQSRPAV